MFRNLMAEMTRKNVTAKEIANYLGVTEKTVRNKISGQTEFTWREVCIIQQIFFPTVSKDTLFHTEKTTA